jgi:glycosyltransferase involved in cell wall biosynthesis
VTSLSSQSPGEARPLLAHIFPTFEVGGAQSRFATLANHFGNDVRHVVVAMDGCYDCAKHLAPGLDVDLRRYPVKRGRMLANRSTFRAALKDIRPDILVTHNWGTIEWAIANCPKVVRHIHIEDGFGPDETKRQALRRIWARRLLLRRSTVVVPSRNLERIAREIWRLPVSSVRYIPNGIDCAKFGAPPDPDLVRRWPGEGYVIGTVAVLRAEKNVERLVRAFGVIAKAWPCRLVIVGDGAERSRLEGIAAELGVKDRVCFTGTIVGTERVYGGFDVFALTSDTEQMPLTVLEAMAAARPIVATEVGDIWHMVAPENRPYLVARDAAAIAEVLRRLLPDRALRLQLGQANRKKVLAEYDQSTMVAAFADLYGLKHPRSA